MTWSQGRGAHIDRLYTWLSSLQHLECSSHATSCRVLAYHLVVHYGYRLLKRREDVHIRVLKMLAVTSNIDRLWSSSSSSLPLSLCQRECRSQQDLSHTCSLYQASYTSMFIVVPQGSEVLARLRVATVISSLNGACISSCMYFLVCHAGKVVNKPRSTIGKHLFYTFDLR